MGLIVPIPWADAGGAGAAHALTLCLACVSLGSTRWRIAFGQCPAGRRIALDAEELRLLYAYLAATRWLLAVARREAALLTE